MRLLTSPELSYEENCRAIGRGEFRKAQAEEPWNWGGPEPTAAQGGPACGPEDPSMPRPSEE